MVRLKPPTPKPRERSDRGQVGIETLIIFIAMILVAAVAAGVLIQTAGFLQNKASSTSSESQQQVSNQVIVISAVGEINDSRAVNRSRLTVMLSPGAEEIDLAAATIEVIGPHGQTTLTYNGTHDEGNAAEETFGVQSVKDEDSSLPVINAKEDRMVILTNHSGSAGDVLAPLQEGAEVTYRITTQSGSQYTFIGNVPESLSSKSEGEAVQL